MTEDEIAQLPKFEWMPSRIPKRNALVAFIPESSTGCPPAIEAASQKAPSRWYPQPGGLRVLILYEGGSYDAKTFQVETGAWDHEDCDVCDKQIPPMTLCYVTKRGRYISLCEPCYRKHVEQIPPAA